MSNGVTDVTWRKGLAGCTVQLEDGAASAVCVLGGRREVTQRRAKTHFGLVQGTEKQRHCADSPGKGGLTSPSGTGNSCSRWNWEFLSLFLHAECALRFELWLNCSLPREASLKPTGRINAPSHLFPELLILLSLTTLTNSELGSCSLQFGEHLKLGKALLVSPPQPTACCTTQNNMWNE